MSAQFPAFERIDSQEDQTPSRPLSGPGTSRQTRRLQLRNAGFRGAALPARNVTPKSMSSSNCSSSASGMQSGSDAENVSPSGVRARSQTMDENDRTFSGGILQEIGNSTLTRPKKTRPRLSSGKMFAPETFGHDASYAHMPTSPPLPKTTIRPRAVKNRAKVSHRRRSVSAETSKYIEHLETELADAQSQISSFTSPSVTMEQTSKMRTLNAETKQLQEELADWEAKYEQRVQEEVDKHCTIESGLRNRIRNLEEESEETKFRVQELEEQLITANHSLEAVEAANVQLEKRLEIMSELLAASPTKIDLHAQTPGRARKHVRPQSMLPRFPTASSLMGSPERQPRTQPTSPMFTFPDRSPGLALPSSPSHSTLPFDHSPVQTDMSEVESVFSDASMMGDSVTSVETCEIQTNFNPFSLPMPPQNKNKPMRRMRRFGAGSIGPKPLILPSTTSHGNQYPPASAPPLERSETTPAFFPPCARTRDIGNSPLLLGRRRASTIANEMTMSSLDSSPFPDMPYEELAEDTMVSLDPTSSDKSQPLSKRLSSLGSMMPARNLMDELTAVLSNGSAEITEPTNDERQDSDGSAEDVNQWHETTTPSDSQPLLSSPPTDLKVTHSLSRATSISSLATRTKHRRTPSIPVGHAQHHPTTLLSRLRLLFGDLWRSPLALARHLVQTAQARMRIPRPLLNVQWWLVGVLLGPMAKRRMLSHTCHEDTSISDLEDQPLLLEDTPSKCNSDLAYGAMASSPAPRPKKRADAAGRIRCPYRRSKHSPWLWLKFSLTLAFAVGAAFTHGPGTLLKTAVCSCHKKKEVQKRRAESVALA